MVVGMLVVLAALLVVYAAIRLLHRILEERPPRDAATANKAPMSPATRSPAGDAKTAPDPPEIDHAAEPLPPRLIAVIAAAATAKLGRPVRVKRAIQLTEDHRAWIAGGRAEIMHSHRPTRPR
jgi:Na+-transporting methylmalonyl-CoA/oxaloacetate decarboxylase gamma subunit